MTYQINSFYPDPITAGYKLLATSHNFDYFTNGQHVFSYGKTELGTRTTGFGNMDYWRARLHSPNFRVGVALA